MACQILLEQVDLINGQRDDLAVHVGADQNHRAGQVVLAAHLQHLRRVVAEQQRGVGKVQAGIILLKAGQDAGSLVQRDDGQLHIRGNGCEVDLTAAPVCRQCSADTHINGDFFGADGTGSVVFHTPNLAFLALGVFVQSDRTFQVPGEAWSLCCLRNTMPS